MRAVLGARSETGALDSILADFFSLIEADVPTFGPIISKIRAARKLHPADILTESSPLFKRLEAIERALEISVKK